MRILLIDLNEVENGLGFDEFVKPIERAIGNRAECFSRHFSKVSQDDLKSADKVILSGTPLMDFAYLEADFGWLKDFSKPLLGVCAGMQVLILAFNGKLKSFRQIGMAKIRTVADNPLFSGEFRVYSLHAKGVEPNESFSVLARSRGVEAVKHKSKPLYGVLFHPEVRNQEILENFAEKA